jgi:hypothetical protein
MVADARYDNVNSPFTVPGTALTSWSLKEGLGSLASMFPEEGDIATWDDDDPGAGAGAASFATLAADTTMLYDRPKWSLALIPDATKGTERNPKEPLWGEVRSVVELMKRVAALAMMYDVQADACALRWDKSMWDFHYDRAYHQMPGFRPVLEMFSKLRDELEQRLPLHPLLATSPRLMSGIQLSTIHGTVDAYVKHINGCAADHGVTPPGQSGPEELSSTNTSVAALRMVTAAFSEFARLNEIAAAGEKWPAAWLQEVAGNIPESQRKAMLTKSKGKIQGGAGVLMSDALHRLSALSNITDTWPELTRALDWTGGAPELQTQIDANGCDFVLTDGDGWSDNPIAVLAGLKPAMPVAYPKAAGISVRFNRHFGTGPKGSSSPEVGTAGGLTSPVAFEWSVVTAEGYMSALDGNEVLSRFYMPPGMLMGEDGGLPKFATDDDPNHVAVGKYFKSKSEAGYIRQWAVVPDGLASVKQGANTRLVTDWGAWVIGEASSGDDPAATKMLLDAYPDQVDTDPQVYIFREKFNMRFPVRLARANCYMQYDELGAYQKTVDFEGFVIFGGEEIDLRAHGTAGLQALIDQLPLKPVDGIAGGEAKPPTEATFSGE